jgi:hypothetical protein
MISRRGSFSRRGARSRRGWRRRSRSRRWRRTRRTRTRTRRKGRRRRAPLPPPLPPPSPCQGLGSWRRLSLMRMRRMREGFEAWCWRTGGCVGSFVSARRWGRCEGRRVGLLLILLELGIWDTVYGMGRAHCSERWMTRKQGGAKYVPCLFAAGFDFARRLFWLGGCLACLMITAFGRGCLLPCIAVYLWVSRRSGWAVFVLWDISRYASRAGECGNCGERSWGAKVEGGVGCWFMVICKVA